MAKNNAYVKRYLALMLSGFEKRNPSSRVATRVICNSFLRKIDFSLLENITFFQNFRNHFLDFLMIELRFLLPISFKIFQKQWILGGEISSTPIKDYRAKKTFQVFFEKCPFDWGGKVGFDQNPANNNDRSIWFKSLSLKLTAINGLNWFIN